MLPVSSLSFESQYTVNRCEQRIIAAASNVHAGMNLRSALSVKDVSCLYKLSVGSLRAKSLDSESLPFFVEPTPFYEQKTEGSAVTWVYTSSN